MAIVYNQMSKMRTFGMDATIHWIQTKAIKGRGVIWVCKCGLDRLRIFGRSTQPLKNEKVSKKSPAL